MRCLRCWIGNYDGRREGLVIASTKGAARAAIPTGRTDFERYWCEQADLPADVTEVEVLYTRPNIGSWRGGGNRAWVRGRCVLR